MKEITCAQGSLFLSLFHVLIISLRSCQSTSQLHLGGTGTFIPSHSSLLHHSGVQFHVRHPLYHLSFRHHPQTPAAMSSSIATLNTNGDGHLQNSSGSCSRGSSTGGLGHSHKHKLNKYKMMVIMHKVMSLCFSCLLQFMQGTHRQMKTQTSRGPSLRRARLICLPLWQHSHSTSAEPRQCLKKLCFMRQQKLRKGAVGN